VVRWVYPLPDDPPEFPTTEGPGQGEPEPAPGEPAAEPADQPG